MPDRFFVESPILGTEARLEGAEAHHLAHVLRASAGHEVILFDGSGGEFLARVEQLGKHGVSLAIVERREVCRELAMGVELCVALPKGDRQKWLVEKATELGATALVPLVTQRGVAQPTAAALDRLRRWVIEAAKQCGRNRLLEIREPLEVAALASYSPPGARRFVAHCEQQRSFGSFLSGTQFTAACVAIGPEGGFTDAEVNQLRAGGWQAVSLGSRILRVETAALMALCVLAAHMPE